MKLTKDVITAVLDKFTQLNIGIENDDNFEKTYVAYECKTPRGWKGEPIIIVFDLTKSQLIYILANCENDKEAIAWCYGCTQGDIDSYASWIISGEAWQCGALTEKGTKCHKSIGTVDFDFLDFALFLDRMKHTGIVPVMYCKQHSQIKTK